MENLIVIVLLGAALAGFVQGLSGSNFGLVAMAVWAWLLDPTLTGPLIVCGSLTGQLLAIRSLRQGFNRQLLLPMLAGGLLGVPLGVALLHLLDPTLFRLGVGVLLLVWCPLMLLSRELPRIAWGGRGVNAGVVAAAAVVPRTAAVGQGRAWRQFGGRRGGRGNGRARRPDRPGMGIGGGAQGLGSRHPVQRDSGIQPVHAPVDDGRVPGLGH